jgi:hypothetical protein
MFRRYPMLEANTFTFVLVLKMIFSSRLLLQIKVFLISLSVLFSGFNTNIPLADKTTFVRVSILVIFYIFTTIFIYTNSLIKENFDNKVIYYVLIFLKFLSFMLDLLIT